MLESRVSLIDRLSQSAVVWTTYGLLLGLLYTYYAQHAQYQIAAFMSFMAGVCYTVAISHFLRKLPTTTEPARNGDVSASVKREASEVFRDVPIIPTLTITHVYGKSGTEFAEPVLNTLTMLSIGDSPADLAKAFLTFVSQKTVPYTNEDLRMVAGVITGIHQRP